MQSDVVIMQLMESVAQLRTRVTELEAQVKYLMRMDAAECTLPKPSTPPTPPS